jgi:hypothetical protein
MIAQVFLRRTQTEQLKPTVITIPLDKCATFSIFAIKTENKRKFIDKKRTRAQSNTILLESTKYFQNN